jgi:hypothetical protein
MMKELAAPIVNLLRSPCRDWVFFAAGEKPGRASIHEPGDTVARKVVFINHSEIAETKQCAYHFCDGFTDSTDQMVSLIRISWKKE